MRPAADFPSENSYLPSDLSQLDASNPDHLSTTILSQIYARNISNFGRQVQAAYFLNRISQAICLPVDVQERILGLIDIDRELQTFLILLMQESTETSKFLVGAITIAVRFAYPLHSAQVCRTTITVADIEQGTVSLTPGDCESADKYCSRSYYAELACGTGHSGKDGD